jgi:hypothetical protein
VTDAIHASPGYAGRALHVLAGGNGRSECIQVCRDDMPSDTHIARTADGIEVAVMRMCRVKSRSKDGSRRRLLFDQLMRIHSRAVTGCGKLLHASMNRFWKKKK